MATVHRDGLSELIRRCHLEAKPGHKHALGALSEIRCLSPAFGQAGLAGLAALAGLGGNAGGPTGLGKAANSSHNRRIFSMWVLRSTGRSRASPDEP